MRRCIQKSQESSRDLVSNKHGRPEREIDTRVVKSSLLIWILDFPSCFFQKKINEKSKNSLLEEDIWQSNVITARVIIYRRNLFIYSYLWQENCKKTLSILESRNLPDIPIRIKIILIMLLLYFQFPFSPNSLLFRAPRVRKIHQASFLLVSSGTWSLDAQRGRLLLLRKFVLHLWYLIKWKE